MKKFLAFLSLAALSGCGTFRETTYPSVEVTSAPKGKNVTVAVTGFDAVLIDYISVHSWQSVYMPGYYGYRYYHPGYVETVPTTTIVPRASPTDMFRARARDAFERAAFSIGANVPDWTVEVRFNGPFVSSVDAFYEWTWRIGTLFFCDYAAQKWTADLKIRDNRSGKLVFSRTYEQSYETHAYGLIPIFGISACDGTTTAFIQNWCLSALTDRTVADAAAFLTGATGK